MRLAIIGGTGLARLEGMEVVSREPVRTPFGESSSQLTEGLYHGEKVFFLARHGDPHVIPPHKINYRANIWALKDAGVKSVLAVAAVGGIGAGMAPGAIVVPDQIIDYSYGRDQTFFEDNLSRVNHIDFTYPYSQAVRAELLDAGDKAGVEVIDGGVYGCTQGPRLETAAEIARMRRDGCDLVGMTGMPEASLARELDLDYACCAAVVNWAAGMEEGEITMEQIEQNLRVGMEKVHRLLAQLIAERA